MIPSQQSSSAHDLACAGEDEFIPCRDICIPGPIVLLAYFAYVIGQQSFAPEDDDWLERVERQAERSRKRRLERQRDLARRLAPLQNAMGWTFVTDDGLPTTDAYVFLALAVVVQLTLASALAEPFRQAFS